MSTIDPTAPARPRRWRRRLVALVACLVLALLAYIPLVLWWSYSDGERVGVVQKLSHKGWLCKTYEGELAMYIVGGMAPQIWPFTVRDPAIAAAINKSLGLRVRLHYTEHRGLPTSCLGDTGYFVDHVEAAAP